MLPVFCALLPVVAAQTAIQAPQRQLRGTNSSLSNLSAAVSSPQPLPLHIAYSPEPLFCLSADGNRIANGVNIQLWKCDSAWRSKGQNLLVDAAGRIRMHANPEYCIVIDWNRLVNGQKIHLWRCDETDENQIWNSGLTGRIRAQGAPMCLVVDGNEPHNGAKIQLWTCSSYTTHAQDWMRLQLAPSRQIAFASPRVDGACSSPFLPVDQGLQSCAAAAEIMRPGKGCQWFDSPLKRWSELVTEVDKPLWPKGCFFRSACQGGCGLSFNPTGHNEGSYPDAGDCQSINVICWVPVA